MRRVEGFTLLEVMIALFVLGIGLIGVAGLQSVSTSMSAQSAKRSQAVLLAQDMADRMRANNQGVDDGDYDMGGGAAPAQNTDCENTTGCGTAALAAHDLWEWTRNVDDALPRPPSVTGPAQHAQVCLDQSPSDGTPTAPACDNGPNANYVIKVWWYDTETDDAGNRGDTQRFVTEFQP